MSGRKFIYQTISWHRVDDDLIVKACSSDEANDFMVWKHSNHSRTATFGRNSGQDKMTSSLVVPKLNDILDLTNPDF